MKQYQNCSGGYYENDNNDLHKSAMAGEGGLSKPHSLFHETHYIAISLVPNTAKYWDFTVISIIHWPVTEVPFLHDSAGW